MKLPRLLLIDDHRIVAEGLKGLKECVLAPYLQKQGQ